MEEEKTIFCSRCGQEMDENEKFCLSCGFELQENFLNKQDG